MHELPWDIGDALKVAWGLSPLDNSAGTRNGTGIDRATPGGQLYMGAVLSGRVGAASGTPTSFSAIYKLQDSADNSTGWADYGTAQDTVTADDGTGQVSVNLTGAKRYIRVVEVIAFVGGTTPKVEGSAVVVLGGARSHPVA